MACANRGNKFDHQRQAMKNRNHRSSCGGWFLHEMILYSLTALACSLVCYHPYWFPSVCGFIQQLPYYWSCLFSPKCLFLVANVIVVFLFGESLFLGSSSPTSNPASQYYEEYVARTRPRAISSSSSSSSSVPTFTPESDGSAVQERKPEMGLIDHHPQKTVKRRTEVIREAIKEEDQEVVAKKVEIDQKERDHTGEEEEARDRTGEEEEARDHTGEEEEARDHTGEEEEAGLPAEELNKRVEDFIARVNKQRWLEAKSLVCCQA